MKRIILAALVGVLALTPAEAVALDGSGLMRMCSNEDDVRELTYCFGYIIGIARAEESLQQAGMFRDQFRQVCVPKLAKGVQLVAIVIKYLNDHPEVRHRPAGAIVLIALRQAFPCMQEIGNTP